MYPLTFAEAGTAAAAREIVAGHPDARFLAGGTTLVDLMKLEVERPSLLVDITRLPLDAISELPSGGIRLGATARNSDLASHPLVRDRYPVLSQAVLAGASPQIRNMATTGGNLMQRTRCEYFRDLACPCNKRTPGSGCGALQGENRQHAVLGTSSHCIATHPSDFAVALTALGAIVQITGARGSRSIPIREFYLVPGDTPEREHALEHGELITAVDVPALPFARRSTYVKVRDRASYAFALASAAVALDLEDGHIRAARIALGGVGTKPWPADSAAAALVGQEAGQPAFEAAAHLALRDAVPHRQNAFKVPLAQRTMVRALTIAAALP